MYWSLYLVQASSKELIYTLNKCYQRLNPDIFTMHVWVQVYNYGVLILFWLIIQRDERLQTEIHMRPGIDKSKSSLHGTRNLGNQLWLNLNEVVCANVSL